MYIWRSRCVKTLGVSQNDQNKKRTPTKCPWAKLKNRRGGPFSRRSFLTSLLSEGLAGPLMKGFFSSEGSDAVKTLEVSQNDVNKKRTPTKPP